MLLKSFNCYQKLAQRKVEENQIFAMFILYKKTINQWQTAAQENQKAIFNPKEVIDIVLIR